MKLNINELHNINKAIQDFVRAWYTDKTSDPLLRDFLDEKPNDGEFMTYIYNWVKELTGYDELPIQTRLRVRRAIRNTVYKTEARFLGA